MAADALFDAHSRRGGWYSGEGLGRVISPNIQETVTALWSQYAQSPTMSSFRSEFAARPAYSARSVPVDE